MSSRRRPASAARRGAADEVAGDLSAQIIDWRTRNPSSANGGRSQATGNAGIAPRHGPFQSVDEVALVPGMTAVLFEALRSSITVYSGRPLVETATASSTVLAAYQGIDPAHAAEMVAARNSTATNDAAGAVAGGKLDPTMPLAGRAISIDAETSFHGGEYRRHAIFRLSGNRGMPHLVLDWR